MNAIKPEDLKEIGKEEKNYQILDFGELKENSLKEINDMHKLFPHWRRDKLIKKLARTVQGDDLRFVARKNGEIVAHIKFKLGKSIHEHIAESTSLIVEPTFRRQGIGIGLMEYSISKLPKKIKLVTLAVDNKNKKAIKLYKKIGFEKYGLLKKGSKINNKFVDNYLMVKEIK
jgi:ribosomal protein S18 acetylase RimI-like enzyme